MGEGDYTVRYSEVSAADPAADALPADPSRVGLIASVAGVVAVGHELWIRGASGGSARLNIPTGDNLELWFSRHGPLVSMPISVWATGGGSTVRLIEVLTVR